MNIKIFVGLMFVAAIMLGVLLVIAYKKSKGVINLMIVSVAIAILFCLSVYNVRTQEWIVEDTPFSTVTDENHIKIELLKQKENGCFYMRAARLRRL